MARLRKDVLDAWQENLTIPGAAIRLISGEKDFNELIQSHPFYEKKAVVIQVDDAFRILSTSRLRIVDLAGKVHFRFAYADQGHQELLDQLSDELYKFSLAAKTLIEMYRRLWRKFPARQELFEDLRDRFFHDHGLASFVSGLRNNYGHSFIATPRFSGKMSLGEPETAQTKVFLAIEELLRYGSWSNGARKYMEGKERLEVLEVTENYFRSAKSLYDCYVAQCGLDGSDIAREYYRLQRANKTHIMYWQAKIWGQMAVDKGYDIRAYFGIFLSEDDVARLKCFNPGGEDEFLFLMSLTDPVGVLNEGERRSICKILNAQAHADGRI